MLHFLHIKEGFAFMTFEERKAQVRSYLGKTVRIEMDRPIGTEHPKHPGLFYPINYGYIPGVYGGDGEELDVYLLGVDRPVKEYTARIIGIVHRHNDVEDKLVAAAPGTHYTKEEMEAAIRFQESYYQSEVEPLAE
jgi:inorganic pyrophosphatase